MLSRGGWLHKRHRDSKDACVDAKSINRKMKNGREKIRNYIAFYFFLLSLYLSPYYTVYKSCKEIYNERPWSATGVYDLESGKHFCYMDDISGATGGWTLALKIDGSKVTMSQFSYYLLQLFLLYCYGTGNTASLHTRFQA